MWVLALVPAGWFGQGEMLRAQLCLCSQAAPSPLLSGFALCASPLLLPWFTPRLWESFPGNAHTGHVEMLLLIPGVCGEPPGCA